MIACLAVVLAWPPAPAGAWKPPSHLFATEFALQDVLGDDDVTIPDVSGDPAKAVTVRANPVIARAVRTYPEAYRAGVLGPDAFPDMAEGQAGIHPDTRFHNGTSSPVSGARDSISDEWLSYLWQQAWRGRTDFSLFANDLPPGPDDTPERLRDIAFAVGYVSGHANGDMWAHTLVNSPELSDGVFPDVTDVGHARIGIKHVVVEGYIDRHRPGFGQTSYAIDVPAAFVARTLITSDFARRHSELAGAYPGHKILGPFVERYYDLRREQIEIKYDDAHQDCIAGDDCRVVTHDPVGGVQHTHKVCDGDACVPDIADAPLNPAESAVNAASSAYFDAWAHDIEDGIQAWVAMSQVIARQFWTGGTADYAVVEDAAHDWVQGHMLSMLGLPDFVGDGALLLSNAMQEAHAFLFSCGSDLWQGARNDPVVGGLFQASCRLYGEARDTVVDQVSAMADQLLSAEFSLALGVDRDGLDPLTASALDRAPEDGNVSALELARIFSHPEDYIGDLRLFDPGTQQRVDDLMDLTADGRYQIDGFAALKDTETLAKLGFLDEDGLNALVRKKAAQSGDGAALHDLYHPYVNYGDPASTPPGHLPTNVMLGWMMALDGDHQWRTTSLYHHSAMPLAPAPGHVWYTLESGALARIDVADGTRDTFPLPGYPGLFGGPKKLALYGAGIFATGVVEPYDGQNWAVVGDFVGGGWVSHRPLAMEGGKRPAGILPSGIFTDNGTDTISQVTARGFTTLAALKPGSGPLGIAEGPDGAVWFTEQGGNRIGRLDGGRLQELEIPTPGSQPNQIAAGPDGAMWFGEVAAGQIGRVAPSGAITEFPLGDLMSPQGITAGPDGAVWFVATGSDKIGRITPDGLLESWDIPNDEPESVPALPVDIALGPDGNLWFTEKGDDEIGRITPEGQMTEYPAGDSPYGIAGEPAPPAVAPPPPSDGPVSHGLGRMWLWEDCVSRRTVWRSIFREPVPGHVAFTDVGDPPSNLTDRDAPTISLSVTGPHVDDGERTYVGAGAHAELAAADNFDPRDAVRFSRPSNPSAIDLGGADGPRTVSATAADACGNEAPPFERQLVVDTTPPQVAVDAPAGAVFAPGDRVPVGVSATDAASGVAGRSLTLDGAPVVAGSVLRMADLAAGAHTLVARAVDRVGNAARATRTFTVAGTGPAPLPSLRITDARRREGDAGRHAAVLTITLSRAAAGRVEVRFATRDATARAGSDYVARKGTLTIAPRTRAATVAVPVRGDRRRERDEALTVRLSRPRDARIADGSGRVTIVDDD